MNDPLRPTLRPLFLLALVVPGIFIAIGFGLAGFDTLGTVILVAAIACIPAAAVLTVVEGRTPK